ncbi:hypothetical protein [Psychroflexus salis]|uniref:Uncharacterized protein n=1 Tax=Psychroflexus salis TaxID=1526574 RepID=A0A916ZLU6_9FLAO|nr:hypothetical protein [Psychroflexus salis]GGE02668.1 hypothetical protein GCM10010831_00480 [Psychroflexus salis]
MNNLKNKYPKYFSIAILVCLLITTQLSFGQSFEDALGFDDSVDDVPQAPISALVTLGLVIGSFFGYRKFKK